VLASLPLLVVNAGPPQARMAEKLIDCGIAGSKDGVVITKVTVGDTRCPAWRRRVRPTGRAPTSQLPRSSGRRLARECERSTFSTGQQDIVWAGINMDFATGRKAPETRPYQNSHECTA